MSVTQQTQMVEQYVTVMQCDGPDCNVERVVRNGNPESVPEDWWYVRQSHSYHQSQERNGVDEGGPWHFHNLRCQQAWCRDRADREDAGDIRR